MTIPQYTQPANIHGAALQQTMTATQKQAQMFSLKGGADSYTAPDMGATNQQTQQLANKVAGAMAHQQSQAYNDSRYKGGKMKRRHTIKKYNRKRTTRKYRKHNKRNTKRKYTKG
jgi:hypothetical protein